MPIGPNIRNGMSFMGAAVAGQEMSCSMLTGIGHSVPKFEYRVQFRFFDFFVIFEQFKALQSYENLNPMKPKPSLRSYEMI